MTSSVPTKAITGSDIFLINRNEVSYTITAQQAKDVVNPEGILYAPTITNIVDQQGYDILSGSIEFISENPNETTLETLYSEDIANITEFPQAIEMSEPYVPVSSTIESVVVDGADYDVTFRNVNYDIKFFKAGDFVKVTSLGLEGKIKKVTTFKNEITVESDDNRWISCKNERVILDTDKTAPIVATGDLTAINVSADGKTIDCTVKNVTGTWISKYNNPDKKIYFRTSLPFGGFQVPVNGFEFIASPVDIREDDNISPHTVLELQEVTWRVNGNIYNIPPILGDNMPQKFTPPNGDLNDVLLDENAINWISVSYKVGQYRESSPRYYFIASSNPTKEYDTVNLFNRMSVFRN